MTFNWKKVKNYVKEHKELLISLGILGASTALICYGASKYKEVDPNDLKNFEYTGKLPDFPPLYDSIDQMSRGATKAYTSMAVGDKPVTLEEAVGDMIAKTSPEELSNISGMVVFTKE